MDEAPTQAPDVDDPAAVSLSSKQAAAAAHVTEDVIRQWAFRGLITAVTGKGGLFYRELDVLQAEASTRRTPRAQNLLNQAAQGIDPPTT